MIGRKKKVYGPLWVPVEVQNENGARFLVGMIQLFCPVCGSPEIGPFGTRGRKSTRVETFQCKNDDCTHLGDHKKILPLYYDHMIWYKGLLDQSQFIKNTGDKS